MEFFETLEDAIVREVKEETGLTVEVIDLLGVTNHIIHAEGLHWVTTPFLVKIKEGIPANLEPQKHLDLRWFPLNNLPENITMTTRKALEDLTKWRIKNNLIRGKNMNEFDIKAPNWDSDPAKVERARRVTEVIKKTIGLTKDMTAFEYGCGTGLLSFNLYPYLNSIF